jgi:hypothetical protein
VVAAPARFAIMSNYINQAFVLFRFSNVCLETRAGDGRGQGVTRSLRRTSYWLQLLYSAYTKDHIQIIQTSCSIWLASTPSSTVYLWQGIQHYHGLHRSRHVRYTLKHAKRVDYSNINELKGRAERGKHRITDKPQVGCLLIVCVRFVDLYASRS